jgi:hypothetical protein
MASTKGIVFALIATGKSGKTLVLTKSRETAFPAGKQLMSIRLMPHIPYDLVPGAIEDPVQGQGKLYYAQIRGQVAAIGGNYSYQFFSYLNR